MFFLITLQKTRVQSPMTESSSLTCSNVCMCVCILCMYSISKCITYGDFVALVCMHACMYVCGQLTFITRGKWQYFCFSKADFIHMHVCIHTLDMNRRLLTIHHNGFTIDIKLHKSTKYAHINSCINTHIHTYPQATSHLAQQRLHVRNPAG